MKRLLAVAAALITLSSQAQDLGRVRELYNEGMYSQAVSLLEGSSSGTALGYRALCALAMGTGNSWELANSFIGRYPENVLVPEVRFRLGLDYFDREMFEQALDAFTAIPSKDVLPSYVPEYTYKMGYSAYRAGEWERAKGILSRFRSMPDNDFTAPSYYAIGYICYAQRRFREASEWFLLASKDYRFTALANYYILECRFNEKDYKYVVQFGEDLFDKVPGDRQPHMARIMSESYLVLGDVEKARTYYERNLRAKQARTRSDFFYAGEVLYMVEDWEGSMENFMQMGERTDSIGQIASYQLGYGNIKLRNKVAAMQAFKEAAALDFSKDIKEDAWYNYAKLAFDLGGDIGPFKEYIAKYGTSAKGDRIYTYMAMAALRNHDYQGAVEAYDHVENLEPQMQANYMKAYLLRAMELMEIGSWRQASTHLKTAAYYSPRRDGFNQLARYYLAETFYRDGKYSEARSILKDLYNLSALQSCPEGALISYQVAYTYFKEGDYKNALSWFDNYLESDSLLTEGSDAETRIADCYFFTGQYAVAVNAYERQIRNYPGTGNLYSAYRAGMASGLVGDEARKVDFLEKAKLASPQTPYYSESMYELGRAYIAVNDREDAVRTFKTLHKTTSDPTLASRALLELGTLARGEGNTADAMDYYKEVVRMQGPLTEDALLAIEALYRSGEDPEAYIAYVNSIGSAANRSEAQKEEVYFSSAEQIFLTGDYHKALSTMKAYLEAYPSPNFGAKAHFYIAESYRNLSQTEMAADEYLLALSGGLDGSLAESATLNYARMNYSLGNYAKAYGSYVKLKEIARMDEYRTAAVIGIMRSAFSARQWEDALASVGDVRRLRSVDEALMRESSYVQAKSLMSTSRRQEALSVFRTLAQSPSTPEGAEAVYILIQDAYDSARFDGIRESVYDFAAKAGDQNYWLAKAFIILGDTFADEGNFAQAQATFESIASGYTPQGNSDDVLDQVQIRLLKLQQL